MKILKTPVRAVWPPLLLTVLALGCSVSLLQWFNHVWWSYVPLVSVLLLLLDTRARIRQYHDMIEWFNCDHLSGMKFQVALYRCKGAWCTRTLAKEAVYQIAGDRELATSFYRLRGYRWYHIFPDKTFTLHSPFLSINFWRGLLMG